MNNRVLPSLLAISLMLLPACAQNKAKSAAEPLVWHPWSDAVFAQARQQHRFVYLDLQAVWCHWCHVMDEVTFRDPQVVHLLQTKYILVRADQDSRPDLSNRYEDYGWPATVVFNAKGGEIVKRQGYLPPKEMVSMLRAIIADPSPGPSVTAEKRIVFAEKPDFTPELQARLERAVTTQYDAKEGGWGFVHKYLEAASVEYTLSRARQADANAEHMARQTLALERQLLDPVWGGAYQYSASPDWKEPHFEKIMSIQADDMRLYALAYAQWHDPADLKSALNIHGYLKNFLMAPQGVFYVSQDADLIDGVHSGEYFKLDDAGRRKQGIPRIDKHVYARENGWVINALCTLYSATGNDTYLHEAETAANWILAQRSLPGGGFSHDDRGKDAAGPYLGDTSAMAQAFLALYSVSGNREWLAGALRAVQFIAADFRNTAGAGFVTSMSSTDPAYKPKPQRDENIMVARTANLLFHYTNDQTTQDAANSAMRYLATPEIARQFPSAGPLLAEAEFTSTPVHITIVGGKGDASAAALFKIALQYPGAYKRIEWWDRHEGALPNSDVQYPELKTAAAFLCTDRMCSSPLLTTEKLAAYLRKR